MIVGLEPQLLKHRCWIASCLSAFSLLSLFVQIPSYLHIYLMLTAHGNLLLDLHFLGLRQLFSEYRPASTQFASMAIAVLALLSIQACRIYK